MASASLNGENLINCPKCLSEYDAVDRIPKFLSCYHTVCLRCILEMQQTTRVSCPICLKIRRVDDGNADSESLISNPHALFLVNKMKEQIKPTDTINKVLKEENSTTCTEQINGSTLSKCQTLLALKRLYFKKKMDYLEKLGAAAGVRQQLKAYLAEVLEALKSITSQIKSLEEENESLLNEMTSKLEKSRKLLTDGSQDEENEYFLSLFYTLITPSELDEESYDILSAKLNEFFNEEKMKLELDAESSIHKQAEAINKTKLLIKLFSDENDINSRPFEINSFTAKWKEWTASNSILTQKQRDQLVLSYLILSLKGDQQESACSSEETVAVVSSSSAAAQPAFPSPSSNPSKSRWEITTPNSVKDKSFSFTIAVTKTDENLKDSIHIKPSLAGQSFIQEIGKGIHLLYYRKARVLRNVGKAELVTIPLKLNEIQLLNMPSTFIQESLDLKPRDVYLVKEKEPGGNQQATTWFLCFVLKESTIPLPQAVFFGNVEKGLTAISNFAKADDRSNYTFSVEANK